MGGSWSRAGSTPSSKPVPTSALSCGPAPGRDGPGSPVFAAGSSTARPAVGTSVSVGVAVALSIGTVSELRPSTHASRPRRNRGVNHVSARRPTCPTTPGSVASTPMLRASPTQARRTAPRQAASPLSAWSSAWTPPTWVSQVVAVASVCLDSSQAPTPHATASTADSVILRVPMPVHLLGLHTPSKGTPTVACLYPHFATNICEYLRSPSITCDDL